MIDGAGELKTCWFGGRRQWRVARSSNPLTRRPQMVVLTVADDRLIVLVGEKPGRCVARSMSWS
jgi:hypothetical protein